MAPGLERWSAGTCRRMRAGTRESAAQAAVSLFPSLFALRSPVPRLRGAKRRKGAGPRLSPPPPPAFDWLLQLSIQNLFLMEGGCHPVCPRSRLPLAANQSGPSARARSDWGRVSSAPRSPVWVPPPPGPEVVYPALPGHLPLVEVERRPRSNAEAKCSEPGIAAGRSPRLGGWGGRVAHRGPSRTAEEE